MEDSGRTGEVHRELQLLTEKLIAQREVLEEASIRLAISQTPLEMMRHRRAQLSLKKLEEEYAAAMLLRDPQVAAD